jgi:hypothetical protein
MFGVAQPVVSTPISENLSMDGILFAPNAALER